MPPKHTRRAILVYLGLAFSSPLGRSHAAPARSLEDLLRAIKQVESGGEPNGGRDTIADGGRSIGPMCIGKAFWLDSRVPGRWEDVRELAYAQRVTIAFWRRYAPSALQSGDFETLARVFNGGPTGAKKKTTLPYWEKVRKALNR